MTVGLVVVSHSRALATAAVALARQMVPGDVPIEIAAGLDAGGDEPAFGTDATAIADAVAAADRGDGVVVLMDMGSAVLSAEMALDLLEDDDLRARVQLSHGPLVEGLVVAAVAAAGGGSLEHVVSDSRGGLGGKYEQVTEWRVAAERRARATAAAPPVPAVPVAEPCALVAAPREAPAGEHAPATFLVETPHGLHARPAARLVALVRSLDGVTLRLRNRTAGSIWEPAGSMARVAVLGAEAGHEIEVAAEGPGAAAAVDAVLDLARRRFDEPGPPTPTAPAQAPRPVPLVVVAQDQAAAPMPGSPGIAIGPVHVIVPFPIPVPDLAGDPATEHARLDRALDEARAKIESARAAATRRGRDEAAIFEAYLAMLDDPEFVGDVRSGIDADASAAVAWSAAVDMQVGAVGALPDPYLAARAADFRAVGDQVLRALGRPPRRVRRPELRDVPLVWVVADLTPELAATVDPDRVAGVVLAAGSPMADTTRLLQLWGVPAVLGAGYGVLDLAEGTTVALDGDTGEVVVDPAADQLASFRERAAAHAGRARVARQRTAQPAVTRDGVEVRVGADIGGLAEAMVAGIGGADLAGLVRTEFLFLHGPPPDAAAQETVYRQIADSLGGRRITLRTLDAGGDKPLPILPLPPEPNPHLGLRGIRLAGLHAVLTHPADSASSAGCRPLELLRDQLRAAVRVAHETPVSLMFPMVSVLDELLSARRELDAVIAAEGRGTPTGLQVGIVVEVPAAALKAAAFVPYVDFLSIGAKGLTQYTMAADLGNRAVARLADPLDPAVLRLVDAVCRAAEGRVPVAVCDGVAGVGLLVGLGVRELSVAPSEIAEIKRTVREMDTPSAVAAARAAMIAPGAAEVRGTGRRATGGGPG